MKQASRRSQLWWLVGLSAFTAIAQYIVQGALATGHNPVNFPAWFWVTDYALWGIRAIIEALVIVYLFATVTKTMWESIIIATFEVSLIALIVVTLGPALRALGYGQTVLASMHEPWYTVWSLAIAGYTPLMMGAAGFAYKVQPEDNLHGEVAVSQDAQSTIDHLQEELVNAETNLSNMVEQFSLLRAEGIASATWDMLSARTRAIVVALHDNGDKPTQAELAEALGVSRSTVSRACKEAEGYAHVEM